MTSNQERLYVASQMIAAVANCLVDYTSCDLRIEHSDLMDLVGRLDVAVEAIRHSNGATDS